MYNLITNIYMINIYKRKQLFGGGGLARISALNSEAIMINIGDYNSKSMGILQFVIVFFVYEEKRQVGGYEEVNSDIIYNIWGFFNIQFIQNIRL